MHPGVLYAGIDMAKRRFELPGVQDLSKEQEAARVLPKEGQHLIVGGPGTGKTVLALIRVRRHARDRDRHVFLVHNHLLHRSSAQLAGETLSSATWERWFAEKFREIIGRLLPREPTDTPGGYRAVNWPAVLDHVKKVTPIKDAPYLVIDEGRVINPSFADYKVFTATEVPDIDIGLIETNDPEGPHGAKGIGEAPVVPMAPAIVNAVYNAIGIRFTKLPLTPERVLRALKGEPEAADD